MDGIRQPQGVFYNLVRNFLNTIRTQKEHKELAIACAEAIEPIFPMIKEFVSL